MPKPIKRNRRAVAVLEVMWDWESRTSSAGYVEQAPSYFRINPNNFTGSRLYSWLGKQGEQWDELLVTNACPELVSNASGRGKPDRDWLEANLLELRPFDLCLVCGKVAQATVNLSATKGSRVIFLPHPAARTWTRSSLAYAGRLIREGTADLELFFVNGRLRAETLCPF